ncbi:MAG: ADOP family duplicated permease [Acidobacteriota bacterium]|nr:ADOP family duplicated permease [Acidobacteriota bacterium]
MDGFLLDVRSAWRAAWRRPALTGLTIFTLVLGIGANTAIFAVARGVLLRPLPYQDPESLVMIWRTATNATEPRGIATPQMLREYRARATSFTEFAAVELWRGNTSAQVDLVTNDGAERLRGSFATPNFFSLVGVSPALGRAFADGDGSDTVILSDGLWRRRFGGDPAIVGQTIDIVSGRARSRQRAQVIGVLPPRFRFTYPEDTELWMGLPWAAVDSATQQALLYQILGRLKPGVSVASADSEMASVVSAMHAAFPKGGYDRMRVWTEPVHEWSVGRVRPAVRLVAGVTLLLLVIAGLNVTSLFLAQTTARRREFALQQSLGASRGRLVRQLLTESAVFTAIAVAAALVVVGLLQQVVRAMLPAQMPRVDEVGVDLLTVAWTTGIGATTLLLAGLLPSWRATQVDLNAELVLGSRTSSGGRVASRLRQGLTMLQLAAASLLLFGGSVLLQSLWNLQHVNLGFDSSVLTQEIRLMGPAFRDPSRVSRFHDDLLQRVRATPGVREASTTSAIPLRGVDFRMGLPMAGTNERLTANRRHVDPAYFDVMRIPLLEGRLLTGADTAASPLVAVVSESLAQRMFPGVSALGQSLPHQRLATTGPPRVVTDRIEIVGVVADVRSVRVDEAGGPAYYVPQSQLPSEVFCLVIRADSSADHVAAAVRTAVRELDPNQPLGPMTTVEEVVAGTIADRRFFAVATTGFGVIAFVLTVAGLCGVMLITAAERVRELGIRVALGATRRGLLMMLLRQGITPVLAGVALGALLAAWAIRFITSYLFGVDQIKAPVYLAVTVLVVVGVAVACLLPARRASMVDPMGALRSE